jgi:RHS repeat-associated protein
MSGKRSLLTVLSIAALALAMAMQSAAAIAPPDNPAQGTNAQPSPHVRPTGHGTPPAGYPAARKASTVRPSVKATPATVTDPQGDTLSVSGATLGSFNSSYWQAAVGNGFGGWYYENCLNPALGYGGTQLPFCAYVQLYDSMTGGTTTTNNTQTDAIYDACDRLVDQQSTYGWEIVGTSYLATAYIGSIPTTVPTSGVCWGNWTVVFTFSQTYNDGQTLSETSSGTFNVYQSAAAAVAAEYPQSPPVGGPVDPSEALAGCGELVHNSATGHPIDTASGDFWHTFTDLSIPGRGPALDLTRTYNSLTAGTDGPFGYGWIDSYALFLSIGSNTVVAHCEGGATMTFSYNGSSWSAPPRVLDTLTQNADGSWTLVKHAQQTYRFDSTGRLTAISDLNGYTTSVSYPSGSQMVVTDPAGRTLTFTLTGNHVTSVSDSSTPPRTVSYGYDASGNLTDVIDVGGGHWQFTYDSLHRILTMRSPRYYGDTTTSPSPVVTNHYDSSGRVDWQTDQLGRQTSFDYTTIPGSTMVTDPKGNVRVDEYTDGLLTAVTKGYGTGQAASTYYRYDPATLGQTMVIDPNGNITRTQYDANGNPTSRTDALGRTTSYTYNALNEITSTTEPKNVNGQPITTSMTYNAAGNLLTKSAPLLDANGATTATATTIYHHDDPAHPGDITSITDPNNNTTVNTYDAYGDLTSATDAAGDKTSYGYDTGRGLRTSMIAPNGNVTGANPAAYTTTYAYDAYGNPTTVRDPLWNSANPTQHQTVRQYDADGNLALVTDGDNHTTGYSYDAAGEQTAVHRPDGSTLRTDYWPDGSVHVQYDGNNQSTTYQYDSRGDQTSVTDPLNRTTSYGYDLLGRLTSKTDPSGRVTTDSYDVAGELVSVNYSDGVTPNVTNIGYDADGQRISMTDGTGTSSWTYDSLHRLTSTTDGAGQTVSYGYDLGGRLTSIGYPGGARTVNRGFDAANRLHTVTDWSSQTTTFNYDANSNLTSEVYPNGTTATGTFDNANRQTGISDAPTANPSSPFATFGYGRDGADLLTSTTSTGVPSDSHSYGYDPVNRLTSVDQATGYGYDAADNPTTRPTSVSQIFDPANQLLASTSSPAISYVGSASAGDATNKTLTLTLPTGTAAGDTVIAAITLDNNKSATLPTGWTGVGTFTSGTSNSSAKVLVYDHTVASGETSVTVTFSAKFAKSVALGTYRSVHPSTPIDVTASGAAASGTSVTAPSVTPTAANDRLLLITGADGVAGTWTAPTGMTSRVQKTGGTTDVGIADQALTGLTATGTRTASHSGNATQLVAAMVTLKANQTNYGYDAQGDRISITPPTGTASALGYDQANRLISYGSTASYQYNGDGQRVSKTVSGSSTAFIWDEADSTPLLLAAGSTYYIYGPGGAPVEQITASGTQYYHQDTYGSTRLLTSSTGSVVASYTYDPYGNLKAQTGTVDTPLRWNGQYQDTESGLYYLRARYYDPVTVQFISRDPLVAATGSAYDYAGDSPLVGDDPTGLWPCLHIHCLVHDAEVGLTGAAVVVGGAVLIVGAPEELAVGGTYLAVDELTTAVTADGAEAIVTSAAGVASETVAGSSLAETLGTVQELITQAGYAVAAAKLANACSQGLRTPECINTAYEILRDVAIDKAVKGDDVLEYLNALREFVNAVKC